MSGRVESSWPNLTNVGPSSSSISRRCRPRSRARRASRPSSTVAAARQQVGQLVALEEVAEAVADRDLRDLREPAEVPVVDEEVWAPAVSVALTVGSPVRARVPAGHVRGQTPDMAAPDAVPPSRSGCTDFGGHVRRHGPSTQVRGLTPDMARTAAFGPLPRGAGGTPPGTHDVVALRAIRELRREAVPHRADREAATAARSPRPRSRPPARSRPGRAGCRRA